MSWLDSLRARWLRPEVALFHAFRQGPYGGSNQFFTALRGELRRRGIRVAANLIGEDTRACLLNSFAFDSDRFRGQRRPGCRVVHRVDGPVGLYRGTDTAVDQGIWQVNRESADATIFQSGYCLEAHRGLGLEFRNPTVILNAADPAIFHSRGRVRWDGNRKLRLLSASWSDNPNKGFPTLLALERLLDWDRFEMSFVGRSPVQFSSTKMLPPLASAPLSQLLREHDVFLAPSLNDPCSNAVIEAMSCGLPVLYARSGGHPELVKEGGFGFEVPDEIPSLLDRLAADYERVQRALAPPALAEIADRYLEVMGFPVERRSEAG